MNIHLVPVKAFLEYPFIQLLNQHVDVLNLITFKDKFVVIRNLEFSRILIILKRYFEMINYFKQYVFYYIIIVKSLQKRKTFLNHNCKSIMKSARKFKARKTYL